jgi:hypothetical protein
MATGHTTGVEVPVGVFSWFLGISSPLSDGYRGLDLQQYNGQKMKLTYFQLEPRLRVSAALLATQAISVTTAWCLN